MLGKPPTTPDGEPVGPAPAPEAPAAPPGATLANVGAPAPALDPAAVQAALMGEPDAATDLRWCKVCKALVRPVGKGKCERCNAFLRLNFASRKHPVNVLRREALLPDLLKQFPPANILERTTCERLAGAIEQLEVTKPGSPDWQRLVQTEQTLAASLHDARLSRDVHTLDDTAAMNTDQLIERTTKILHGLLDMHAEEIRHVEFTRLRCAPDDIDGGPTLDNASESCPHDRGADTGTDEAARAPRVAATERCAYCHQAPCIGPEHHAYEVLHWNDPEEIKKRADRATAEMFESMRRARRGWR